MSTKSSSELKPIVIAPVHHRQTLQGTAPLTRLGGPRLEGNVISSAPPPGAVARPRPVRTALRPLSLQRTPPSGVSSPPSLPGPSWPREAPPYRSDRPELVTTFLAMPALDVVREDCARDAAFEAAVAEAAELAPELAARPPECALVLAQSAVRDPYPAYAALGMGAPAPSKGLVGKVVVSSYRTLGFAILTIIVALLVGYLVEQIFYYTSHSWVAPTVVSPSDEKIVALRTEQAAQQNQRDKIVAELDDADRAIVAEGAFQTDFAAAIRSDLAGRKAALGRVQSLAGAANATRHAILATNTDYAGMSADRMQKELAAGLIDRTGALAGSYQLAQISNANLSLAEREAELDGQAADLKAQATALDGLLAGSAAGTVALGYDVLKIKHDYQTSKLALARATETREVMKRSLARQDAILAGLAESAYLRALDDHALVAAVPYENVAHVEAGTPLYACRIGMIVCRQVGKVIAVLPGEVQFKHPKRDAQQRGQLVELAVTDPEAARDTVLFGGGAPLGL